MQIKNFDDINTIRRELRSIESDIKSDIPIFSSIKRILVSEKPSKSGPSKAQCIAIDKLSSILSERQERQQLTDHLKQLLINHFTQEEGVIIKKLINLADDLSQKSKLAAQEADKVLYERGEKLSPTEFKNVSRRVTKTLANKFDIPTKSIATKYYLDITADKAVNHISFTTIKNKDSHDVIIAFKQGIDNNKPVYFVKTFVNTVNPDSLKKTDFGIKTDNVSTAIKTIIKTIQQDKLFD